MLSSTGLAVVRDPEDRFENLEFVRELAEEDGSRLFVPITPCADNIRVVANDLLKALGKDPDFVGHGRNSTELWARAGAWLEVSDVSDIFVSRAHLLKNWLLEQLAGAAARSGVRLWLIFQSAALRADQERFIANWPVADLDFAEFAAAWPKPGKQRGRGKKRTPQVERLPEVPIDDFPTWRASCRALLSPEDFERVDAEFLEALDLADDMFEAMPVLDEAAMCTYTRELIAECDWMPQVITRIRGAQVAAFHAGYLMKVNLDPLCSASVCRLELDNHVVEELWRYTSPRHSAAAVVLAAAGAQLGDIVAMDLRDVAEDGARIIVAGAEVALPARAAQIIDALVRERLGQRALPEDPLFVYVPGTGKRHGQLVRTTQRALFDNIKKIERETGLLFTAHLVEAGQRDAVAWARRRGISLQRI